MNIFIYLIIKTLVYWVQMQKIVKLHYSCSFSDLYTFADKSIAVLTANFGPNTLFQILPNIYEITPKLSFCFFATIKQSTRIYYIAQDR